MPTVKLTKPVVEKLIATKADALTFDAQHAGFHLRTYASGAPPMWGVKYSVGNATRRMVLGQASWGNIDAMRDLAATVRAKARLGEDTLGDQRKARREPKARKLGDVIDSYLESRADELRARSAYIYRLYLEQHWKPLHGKALKEIARADLLPMLSEMARERGDTTADRAKSALSGLMQWAIQEGYVDTNPTNDIKDRDPNEGRTRVLSADELVRVWNVAGDFDLFGRAVRLLVLLGARRNEVIEMRWPELDMDQCQFELPEERSKIKKPVIIPLSQPALQILRDVPVVVDQPRLFPAFSLSRYMTDFRAEAKLEAHWVLHDIRRSYSTHCNDEGLADPHIIDASMGHLIGNRVSRRYNKAEYLPQTRQLMDLWAQHVVDLVAGRRRKVVPMRRGAA